MDKINQSEVSVTFNTMFNMTCRVESYPLAMVHWEGNNEQVNNNVILVNTSERGETITYTCVAVNVINEVNQSANNSINVIIQGKILCDGYTVCMNMATYSYVMEMPCECIKLMQLQLSY